MAFSFTKFAAAIFAGGTYAPKKSETRTWGGEIENYLLGLSFDTVANMQAVGVQPTEGQTYFLKGITEPGDMGDKWGAYQYVAASTLTEDDITYSVIKPTGFAGRFIRVHQKKGQYFYVALDGQSDAAGSGEDGPWVSNNQVEIWDGKYSTVGTTWNKLTSALRGQSPFAADDSNNILPHVCDLIQRKTGWRVRGVLMAKGGTTITEINQVGGEVYDGRLDNKAAILSTDADAQIGLQIWIHGQADQFETIAWYLNEFETLKAAWRSESWFASDTPIVAVMTYFGEHSSGSQWKQNGAIGLLDKQGDPYVGVVPSYNLTADDEGLTDAAGRPYRVHLDGPSLATLKKSIFDVFWGLRNGGYTPAAPFMPQTNYPGVVSRFVIADQVSDGGSRQITYEEALSGIIIKCAGDATIDLPEVYSLLVSGHRLNVPLGMDRPIRIFCNGTTKTVTIQPHANDLAALSPATIRIGNGSTGSSATVASSTVPVDLFWMGDGRWRGIKSDA